MIKGLDVNVLLMNEDQLSKFKKGDAAIELAGEASYLVEVKPYLKTWEKMTKKEQKKFESFQEFLYMYFNLIAFDVLEKLEDYTLPRECEVKKFAIKNWLLILIAIK